MNEQTREMVRLMRIIEVGAGTGCHYEDKAEFDLACKELIALTSEQFLADTISSIQYDMPYPGIAECYGADYGNNYIRELENELLKLKL